LILIEFFPFFATDGYSAGTSETESKDIALASSIAAFGTVLVPAVGGISLSSELKATSDCTL
jgi:hypothetical protein